MENLQNEIINLLSDGVYFVDLQRRITLWNSAAESITGFTNEEVMGKCCADNILRHVDESGTDLCNFGCPLSETLFDGKSREKNVYLHHKDGHRIHVFTRICPMYKDGQIIGAVEIFTNNSTKIDIIKELEALKKDVYIDTLTQIGNRRYADDILKQRMHEWEDSSVSFTVFFVDLDDFKNINDTYGHDIGDKVLTMSAKSLNSSLRVLDNACRWGGEEFIVIIPNIPEAIVPEIAERLRMLVEKSWILVNENKVSVTASIGCATVKEGDSLNDVISRADKAMYQSKNTGKNRVTIL